MLKFLQPQAVWQLVVLALMSVVTPLSLLLYQTSVSLQTLSQESRKVTEDSIVLAQSGRSAGAALIDMERVTRQYFVIGDAALIDLFRAASEQFLAPLYNMAILIKTDAALQNYRTIKQQQSQLLKALEQAEAEPDSAALEKNLARLARLQQATDQLVQRARTYSEEKLHELGHAAAQVRETTIGSTLILAPVTALLMAVFTYLIVGPIRQLKMAIRTLGIGEHKPVELFGPTELVQLAEELNSLQERLSQVEKQKQQFLRHVSHELKTPLSSILEGTALLKEEVVGSLSQGQREVIGLVTENGRALQQLIENLLNFNQLNYKGKASSTLFDIYTLVEEVVRVHWLSLVHKQQTICVGGPEVKLTAQRPRLYSALDNLLSNAISYGEENGKIWIEWQRTDTDCTIYVANTGTTIAAEEEALIFEPFFQGSVKRSGAVSGSGIGLAVARDCIQSQGGELKLVENHLNRVGFAICLPVKPEENTEDQY